MQKGCLGITIFFHDAFYLRSPLMRCGNLKIKLIKSFLGYCRYLCLQFIAELSEGEFLEICKLTS